MQDLYENDVLLLPLLFLSQWKTLSVSRAVSIPSYTVRNIHN